MANTYSVSTPDHLILTALWESCYYYPHFTYKKTESRQAVSIV